MPLLTALLAQNPIQNWGTTNSDGTINPNSGCLVDGVPTLSCLEIVFGNLLFMSSAFVVLVLFIMFVWGAFTYLTSLGDPEKMQSAKNTFTYAIIGLVVFVSAGLILTIIDFLFLGGQGKIFEFDIAQ